ncbi:MAG TPA: ATP-binding protein [Planctomycetota bacterium]|nr:ATP-binding protein [Planctomycetota bacterium]
MPPAKPFEIRFDPGTIKHLGVQMYSTLPPVIGELVSNAWDADASHVDVTIPTTTVTDASEIVVEDDGGGMTDDAVRNAYLVVGRDRRAAEGTDLTASRRRPIMGRKGIGKFSAFGIAQEIEVETVHAGAVSRFVLKYDEIEAARGRVEIPPLPPSGTLIRGTRITLRKIKRYRTQPVNLDILRRGLARRFSIIGAKYSFEVRTNGVAITALERDLTRLLDKGPGGAPMLWTFKEEVKPGSGWIVEGWIGALNRTTPIEDGIQRGIAIFARGKLVQEPFVFDATVGQQFALSYLVGEVHAEFVDTEVDTIATSRTSLVWDVEANALLKEWGEKKVNTIAREWADKRAQHNEEDLLKHPVYVRFLKETEDAGDTRGRRVADKLIRNAIKDPNASLDSLAPFIEQVVTFVAFDAFHELAGELETTAAADIPKVVRLFEEWQLVEAREMLRVTKGRIQTIKKLQSLIVKDALEVPTLHNFLKKFPWVIDPRWSLVADEVKYSRLLKAEFPDGDLPMADRRIDFLCVRESDAIVVVEIKRPSVKAGRKEIAQVVDYVTRLRELVAKNTDPDLESKQVVGYLLVGDVQDSGDVRQRLINAKNNGVYVRPYHELLSLVERLHHDFLDRYTALKAAKAISNGEPEPAAIAAPTPIRLFKSLNRAPAAAAGRRGGKKRRPRGKKRRR